MKNKIKLFGLIVLIAALAFSFASCKEPEEEDGGGIDHGDGNMLIINCSETSSIFQDTAFANVIFNTVELYPDDTTTTNIDSKKTSIAAGSSTANSSIEVTKTGTQITLTSWLYAYNNGNRTGNRWTGTGSYKILISYSYKTNVTTGGQAYSGGSLLVSSSGSGGITFSAGTTTVTLSGN